MPFPRTRWLQQLFGPSAQEVAAQQARERELADLRARLAALDRVQATIEFALDGTILAANENFLKTMGYALDEIKGRHHSLFAEPAYAASAEYRAFWDKLNRGEFDSGQYRRLAKGGREVWIQASYNPICDLNGKPFKVVKFASDVTKQVIARKKAEHVRSMMESVAAGAEELNVSVKEIASSMAKSKDTANDAAERVSSADQSTHRLSEAAQSMGGVVDLINEITGQINLLALNATIESARAGEAGRGFAVVASEVKNLANQAKQATDTITSEIDALNTISGDVASSLTAIKVAIAGVNEFIASTAAAVEEQSAVTADMSANMQRASAELS